MRNKRKSSETEGWDNLLEDLSCTCLKPCDCSSFDSFVFAHKPVLRDRLFGLVLAGAFAHGFYLVYPLYYLASASKVVNFCMYSSFVLLKILVGKWEQCIFSYLAICYGFINHTLLVELISSCLNNSQETALF